MDARLRELEAENEQLRRELSNVRKQVEKLTALLEEARRDGKRQAAPFRKPGGPKAEPKQPGRKSGKRHGLHAHRAAITPDKIDERHDATLPDACPHCGGRQIDETHTATQSQTEIPRQPIHREFTIHLGRCRHCQRRVQGRHPLQTSDALGAAASQLGSEAHAAFVALNKGLGLAHGKCRQLFQEFFGIKISRSTSVRSLRRTAQRTEPAYQELRQVVRRSPWVVPDETGWRVGGRNAWLHAFVTPTATCYEIGDRSANIAHRLLGSDWSGTMIHDGWSTYDNFKQAFHQQCLGHLQRRCREILETATRGAVNFPRTILTLCDEAFRVRRHWRGHRINGDERTVQGLTLACRLEQLCAGDFTYEPNRTLAKHLLKHSVQWFWFLVDPTIDATNYRAEQAIRPAVANRKVWGGNRTWVGARIQGVLTSLLVTIRQRGEEVMDWFSNARRTLTLPALPP